MNSSGRFLLAVVLMIAVMIITPRLFPPIEQPAPVTPPDTAGAAPVAAPVTAPVVAPATAAAALPAADTVVVRSPLYEYRLSTRGGSLIGARLLRYEVQPPRGGEKVELAPAEAPRLLAYRVRAGTREIDLETLEFQPSQRELVLDSAGRSETLTLEHAGEQFGVTLAYTFDPLRYVIDVRLSVRGVGGQTPSLAISMPRSLAINEAVRQEDERALSYVVNSHERGINNVRLSAVEAPRVENGPLSWVAVKNKYFVTAAFMHPEAPRPFGGLLANPAGEEFAADLTAAGMLPASDSTFAFRVYSGPLEPQRLEELGNKFGDVNPFGWRLFRPLLQPVGHAIAWVLYGMHDVLGIGYGWVLILFGVLIRIILWPLNAKAMRSQMKNMEIQPKMKEIQAKFKTDPERLQKEMLKLYKEEGFNPMAGCLPMLIPLPILITLFFVFQNTIAFRGVSFWWLPDLSRADPLYILPIVLGVSMFAMQWLSMRSTPDPNPQMKFMMYFMPIFMTVLFLNFQSGLNLYYAAMNFASIPQQLHIMRERQRMLAAKR